MFLLLDVNQMSTECQALRAGANCPSEAGTVGRHWQEQDIMGLQPCAEVGMCGQWGQLRKL